MTEKETNQSVDVTKKAGAAEYIPAVLAAAALAVSAVGLFRVANIYRQIIYAGQTLVSAFLLVQMIIHLKDEDRKFVKTALYALAVLEALRATILITIGVNTIVGYVARFVLIMLACCCVLTAERADRDGGFIAAVSIAVLEIVLYLVFLFGFPGIMKGLLNRFLPLASVLIAASICLLIKNGKSHVETA